MAMINVKVLLNGVDYLTFHQVDSAAVSPAILNGWVMDAPKKPPHGRIWKMRRVSFSNVTPIPITPLNCQTNLDELVNDGGDCIVEFDDQADFWH
jgi:hypothetical protein